MASVSGLSARNPWQLVTALVDVASVLLAGLITFRVRFASWHPEEPYWLAMLTVALLVVLANGAHGAYGRYSQLPIMLGRLVLVWSVVGVLVMAFIFLAKAGEQYSRLWLALLLLVSLLLAGAGRILGYMLLARRRRSGKGRVGVFLIGPESHVLDVARGMRDNAGEGYGIAGIQRYDQSPDEHWIEALVRRVEASHAREVWICVPLTRGHEVYDIFRSLQQSMVDVRLIPDLKDMRLLNHRASQVAGRYSLDLSVSPMAGMAPYLKRLEDIVLGSLISLLILPVCVAIAVAIKLSSPGPVLFKQYRTGINGKRFKVYKFRSMEVHQENGDWVTQATQNDPRVTRIGAFLRRTSLDELPQFYNVLQGRMSIVGPRPHALAHNDHYREEVESYMRRHKVKPGITGWAQVNGLRGETDTLEKMEQRVEHDLWYIDNWSLWLDLKIILLTVFKGFINPNAY